MQPTSLNTGRTQSGIDLRPGIGIAGYSLGQSVWQISNALRNEIGPRGPSCSLSWASEAPGSGKIILRTDKPDVTLLLEGKTQRSVLIELIYARDQILVYNGKRLGEAGRDISDKDVYRAFGPTYAPSARSSDCISRSTSTAMPLQLISLCYPGIVFTFEKRSTHARTEQVLSMVTVVNSSNSNVELARVTDVLANLENYNLVESGGGLASVEISLANTSGIELVLKTSNAKLVKLKMGHTSTEDILCDLGEPSMRSVKEDSRLNIHATLNQQNSMADTPTPTQDYFLNFFDLGIDFLMDGSRNVLRKVILHSNTPGETQFGRYERCPWQIVVASNASISSGDSVSKALAFLSKQDSDNAISVIKNSKKAAQNPKGFLLDRTADMPDTLQSSKPTEIFGFEHAAIEATSQGEIETLWVF